MSPALPFELADLTLRHAGSEYQAVSLTPKAPMVIGRERLGRLRHAETVNQVERDLVAEVRRRRQVRVVLFRGMNDAGQRVWEFNPALSDTELEDAGVVMTRALLPLHRRLMAAGVMLMVHTELGARECLAFRHAIRMLTEGLGVARDATPLQLADGWLLTRMLLHVSLDCAHVTASLLPAHLGLIDRRWERVQQLVQGLPPEAID